MFSVFVRLGFFFAIFISRFVLYLDMVMTGFPYV